MAGLIGTIPCYKVAPLVQRNIRQRMDLWQVPGVDGVGSQKLGYGEGAFAFEVMLIDTPANIQVWFKDITLLVASRVSITDDWGTVHPGCLIADQGTLQRTARINHDGLGTCIGRTTVSGVYVADA